MELNASSVDAALPDMEISCPKECSRFHPQTWRDPKTDALTVLKNSVSQRMLRLLDNSDYAKLLDAYVRLLEENEELKKKPQS